jgi:hypothetical protein
MKGCTLKELPRVESILLPAAAQASLINPLNKPSEKMVAAAIDKMAIAVMTTKYWGTKGVRLTVAFMESINTATDRKILQAANAWGKTANIEFVRTKTDPQIRVTRSGDGYWSYLGTDILSIPRNEPTMCLDGFTENTPDSEYNRVVKHEFGHTLGFPHEHMRRDMVNLIDANKAIKYFKQTQGWSAADTRAQVLTPLEESELLDVEGFGISDKTSIMCYQLPGSIMKNGQPFPGGDDINDMDARFAAQIYPKAVTPPGPTDPLPPVISSPEWSGVLTNSKTGQTISLASK